MNKRRVVHQLYSMSQNFVRAVEINSRSIIPKSEFKVIYLLNKHQSENQQLLTSSELSELMKVSSPAISRTVKSLLMKELIIQEDDPQDRRNIFLSLTKEGHRQYERAILHMENYMEIIFSEFTEQELETFIETGERLTTVINNIKVESEE